MKKVLLLILLLVLLIGVSAIKTYREHRQRDASFDKGKQASAKELVKLQDMADSLELATGNKEVEFGDSLTRLARQYRGSLDSLEDMIDSQSATISSLKKAAEASSHTEASQKKTTSALSEHEKILTYYKKRYADLPGDLSTYEKKVAVNEIRAETAKRFSISVEELEKIRQANKLNY